MSLTTLYQNLTQSLRLFDTTNEYTAKSEVIGTLAIARAPQIDLAAAVKSLVDLSGVQQVSNFQVLADTMTCGTYVDIPASCTTLTAIARSAFVGQKTLNFVVKTQSAMGIRLVMGGQTATINCYFAIGQLKPVKQTITFDKDSLGKFITVNANGTVTFKELGPLSGNFEYFTAAESIADNGQLKSVGIDMENDNLPKLLDYQLLLAAQNQAQLPDLAYDIASFVNKVTANVPKALDYNSQASSILGSYYMNPGGTVGQYLSPLNVDLTKDVLTARLAAVSTFEQSYQLFASAEATSQNIQSLANAALQNANAAQANYDFLASTAQNNYAAASDALDLARSNFNDIQSTIGAKQKAFQDGIEAWKKKQIAQVVIESVAALVLIGGSIAVAVIVPPAGAEIATGSIAELGIIAKSGNDLLKKMAQIVDMINKIKALFVKMKPALEKIDKLIAAIKSIITMMTKFKRMDGITAGSTVPNIPSIDGNDTINGMADWDVFASDSGFLWDMLQDENIGGAREFFACLQDVAIRAKAVFAAQYAVTTTGQAYTAAMAQALQNQYATQNLQNSVQYIQGNVRNCQILKLALLERLLRIRSNVLFDFRNYVSAYTFYSLDTIAPITLDPLKDLGDFQTDAANLQKKVADAKASINAQQRKFTIHDTDASGAMKLNEAWQSTLVNSRAFTMSIAPDSPIFASFGRIRIVSFNVFLEGAKIAANSDAINLVVKFARDLNDRAIHAPLGIMSFVGGETKAGFEYASKDDILMDGKLLYPQNAVAITPFTSWNVSVDAGTDCSAVTGITLILNCEVSLL